MGVGLDARFLDHGDQLGQHFLHITHDRDIHTDALGNARWVNINVNDLALVLRKMFGVADHAVIKPCANGEQYIAILHGVIGFHRAMHAQHANKLAVAGWVRAQPHQCVRDGIAQHVDQSAELCCRIGQQHPPTGIDIGTLGSQQQLQCLADLTPVPFANRVV